MTDIDPGGVLEFAIPGGSRRGRLWQAPQARAVVAAVHGLESHSLWFGALAAALRDRSVSLLAFDRLGSGLDPRPRGCGPGIATWLADVHHLVAAAAELAPVGEIHLLGHSWGARCVAATLAQDPLPARSILLLTPGLFPRDDLPRPSATSAAGFVAPAAGVPIPLSDGHFTSEPAALAFIAADPLRLRHISPRFVIDDGHLSRRLAEAAWPVDGPPLWLGLAGRDRIVDEGRTKAWLDSTWPGRSRTERFPQAGHLVLLERPDELASAICRWLEDVS